MRNRSELQGEERCVLDGVEGDEREEEGQVQKDGGGAQQGCARGCEVRVGEEWRMCFL